VAGVAEGSAAEKHRAFLWDWDGTPLPEPAKILSAEGQGPDCAFSGIVGDFEAAHP
jgi:hypothetical protein